MSAAPIFSQAALHLSHQGAFLHSGGYMTQPFPILEFDPSYDAALDAAKIITSHALPPARDVPMPPPVVTEGQTGV